jgi:glycosyltransferase involved in cell wall biosynthesis
VDFSDVTFVILTYNEAARIGDCLAALPAGARALVYDALSVDATAAVAQQHGAQVLKVPWQGFARAKEAAAAHVKTPWTFVLDADERVSKELAQEIALLPMPADATGYSIPRRNYFCGRWIRGAGWWPDRLVRLFRTGRARIKARGGKTEYALHEAWVADGATVELQGVLEHHSYASLEEYRARFSRYTSLEAQHGRSTLLDVLGAWCIVPLRAVWLAVVRAGILDGWRGLYVSWWSALYPAVVATKAWRRTR